MKLFGKTDAKKIFFYWFLAEVMKISIPWQKILFSNLIYAIAIKLHRRTQNER